MWSIKASTYEPMKDLAWNLQAFIFRKKIVENGGTVLFCLLLFRRQQINGRGNFIQYFLVRFFKQGLLVVLEISSANIRMLIFELKFRSERDSS